MNLLDEKILAFNRLYKLPAPMVPGVIAVASSDGGLLGRLDAFKKVLQAEVSEVDDIIGKIQDPKVQYSEIALLVDLADWFADIIVYCASEARKYGLTITDIVDLVMASNMSKEFPDGPHYDENGKVQKGPNYWKPEPAIKLLLEQQRHGVGGRGPSAVLVEGFFGGESEGEGNTPD